MNLYSMFGPYLVIVALIFGGYFPRLVLKSGYLFDDLKAVAYNPDVIHPNGSLSKLFRHDFWGGELKDSLSHGSYRPLTVGIYRVFYSPTSNFNLKFFNLCLHSINTVLVAKLARVLRFRGWFFSAVLFGIHPVHSEPVLALVGASDLLYSQCVLLSLIIVLHSSNGLMTYVLSSILAMLSLLFKEQGIMLMPLLFATDFLSGRIRCKKKGFLKLGYSLLFSSGLLYWRLSLVSFKPPSFQEGDNPSSFIPDPTLRLFNYCYTISINLWILIMPDWLCFDWSMGCIPIIKDPLRDYRTVVVFGCLAFSTYALILLLKSRKMILSIIYAAIPFLPSTNIFFRVGFVVAERNLYLSLLGFCLFISEGFVKLKRKNWRSPLAALTIVVFLCQCFKRSIDWSDESRLFESGLKICPRNAKIHYNVAKRESESSHPDNDKVIRYYESSIDLWPTYEHAMNNLGNIYRIKGRFVEAESALKKALILNPTFAACWMNLGILQMTTGNYIDAESSYLRALDYRKGYSDCYYNLGNLYIKMRKYSKARKYYLQSIEHNRKFKQAWTNLILLEDESRNFTAAEGYCLKALNIFENSSEFLFHLGNIYGKTEQYALSEKYYKMSLEHISVKKPLYHLNLGILYHRWKKYDKAAVQYKIVLKLDPENANARKHLTKLQSS